MQILAKFPTGETITREVEVNDIDFGKAKIRGKDDGVASTAFYWKGGNVLEDGHTLAGYNIQKAVAQAVPPPLCGVVLFTLLLVTMALFLASVPDGSTRTREYIQGPMTSPARTVRRPFWRPLAHPAPRGPLAHAATLWRHVWGYLARRCRHREDARKVQQRRQCIFLGAAGCKDDVGRLQ